MRSPSLRLSIRQSKRETWSQKRRRNRSRKSLKIETKRFRKILRLCKKQHRCLKRTRAVGVVANTKLAKFILPRTGHIIGSKAAIGIIKTTLNWCRDGRRYSRLGY